MDRESDPSEFFMCVLGFSATNRFEEGKGRDFGNTVDRM